MQLLFILYLRYSELYNLGTNGGRYSRDLGTNGGRYSGIWEQMVVVIVGIWKHMVVVIAGFYCTFLSSLAKPRAFDALSLASWIKFLNKRAVFWDDLLKY